MNVRAFPALVLADRRRIAGLHGATRGRTVRARQATRRRGRRRRRRSSLAVAVEAQPLAANVERLAQALESLGAPLPADPRAGSTRAGQARDATRLQALLDPRVLLAVHINPEARVKVTRGPAPAVLQQGGYTAVILKIVNESRGTPRLRIGSPQSGPVYAGMSSLSGDRMQQQHLRENENVDGRTDRFLDVEMFSARADDAEPERPGGRVRDRADLLERGRTTRGDDRRSTRAGDPGPRVPRRSPGALRRPARRRREAQRARPRRHADDRPVSLRRRAGPRLSAAGQAAGAGSVLPEAHLPRARRRGAAAARQADDVLRPRARVSLALAQRDDSGAAGLDGRSALRNRRPARALDRSVGARLLQRRPSHPRRRLRALHAADARASIRPTCSGRSRAKGSTSAASSPGARASIISSSSSRRRPTRAASR